MERHSKADETYYVEASKLLELASRAHEIFESSKADGKRELLKYLLQNSEMKGKKVIPRLQMPFDAILLANKTQDWLPQPRLFIPENYAQIVQTFQNLSYIGELRQRWEEIKRSSSVPAI